MPETSSDRTEDLPSSRRTSSPLAASRSSDRSSGTQAVGPFSTPPSSATFSVTEAEQVAVDTAGDFIVVDDDDVDGARSMFEGYI